MIMILQAQTQTIYDWRETSSGIDDMSFKIKKNTAYYFW